MSDVPAEWTFLSTGWRLALILTGGREGASKAFRETIEEVRHHPNISDHHRLEVLFFSTLRRRCLRTPASNELSGLSSRLHRLEEPGRSVLALIWLNAFPINDLHRIIGSDDVTLAEAVSKARAQLSQPEEAAS